MGGILLLTAFLCCGVLATDALLRSKCMLLRCWFGLSLGLMMMMVLPAIFAFALRFTLAAQLCGVGTAALLALFAQWSARGKGRAKEPFCGDLDPRLLLALIPLILLGAYLQNTHTIRVAQDGSLHVGQSTYGDLCLHLGIATSLQNAAFPPDYSLLPGTRLGYPFLADSMLTSMLLTGTGLRTAYVLTGTLMMALVYTGFLLLAWKLTHRKAAVLLSLLLLEFNGGLGFLYVFDHVFRDASALRAVFTGFYKTPTNMPDLNLRWVNLLCDMFIPQRTFLTGWMALIPAVWLLHEAMDKSSKKLFILLGIWAGMMPMIHTHSFVALALLSAGCLLHVLVRGEAAQRQKQVKGLLLYAVVTVVAALPQMLVWTLPQTVGGGSLNLRFNWVNNDGTGHLIDGYFWFWIKNVGPVFLMLLPAALSVPRKSRERAFAWGALCIFVTAELIQFQPNEYDNNKLFYAAYMVMLPLVSLWMLKVWDALREIPGRRILAAVTLLSCTLSGLLSIGREVISDYQLFSAAEADAASFLSEHRDPDTVVLTGDQHNNAPAALAGCRIVCGTGSYLYFHGLDYGTQRRDEQAMLEHPQENIGLFETYSVDYVYLSNIERANFEVDEAWFAENTRLVYESEDKFDVPEIRIYAISDRAGVPMEGENA